MKYKKFITFEGGEGSGKSTQIKLLAKKIEQIDSVCLTREPGGTKSAEEIRKLLVRGKIDKWSSISELLLLFAARKDHIDKLILPSLKVNKWVYGTPFIELDELMINWEFQEDVTDKFNLHEYVNNKDLLLEKPVYYTYLVDF